MALVEGPPLWVDEKIHKMDKFTRERERGKKKLLGMYCKGRETKI